MKSKILLNFLAIVAASSFAQVSALPSPQNNAVAVFGGTSERLVAGRGLMSSDILPMSYNHPARGSYIDVSDGPRIARMTSGNITLMENTDNHWAGTRPAIEAFEKFFQSAFDKQFTNLPTQGRADVNPWPSDYWPNFRDGINHVYEGAQASPAHKYAMAKGIDPKMLADEVSRLAGVEAWSHRPTCSRNEDCTSLNDGSVCAMRRGSPRGHCIPTWFGICHAWAPASIMEPEPRCGVTVSGVYFSIMDIKALVTQIYDGSHVGTYFAGSRCNEKQPAMDQHGRFSDFSCRDVTPDFFHISASNVIGKFRKSFLLDVTANAEVWNQPTLSYDSQSTEVSAQQAMQLLGSQETTYSFNADAKKLMYVKTILNYVVEGVAEQPISDPGAINTFVKNKLYEYILELNEEGVIVGGEWVGKSKQDHPDFLWIPTSKPDSTTVAAGIEYSFVKDLLHLSQACAAAAA